MTMPQLDRLLAHITPRGGLRLRLEPNAPPILELAGGTEVPLLANPLPPTMIEVLAKEVVPSAKEAAFAATGEASFDHEAGTETFRIVVNRGPAGFRITAEPSRGSAAQPRSTVPGGIALAAPPAPAAAPAPAPAPVVAAPPAHAAARAQPVYGSHPMAEALFRALLDHKGSDLHLSSFESPIVRVHGDLVDLNDFGILGPSQIMEIMEALAPEATWRTFTERNDADFAYPFEAGNCRLRVNYFMDRVGPGLVCRVIPNEIPDPDRLGLADPIRRLASLSKGLVLVTGPTGSGKSTTLAAIIDLANQKRDDHILTIEDPIEFVHPRKRCLINQREVGTHTDSFKSGLRAALREDPDIVLVGEMRDLETIAIALETAITGHLVFGTLHTASAIGTVDRIVDQFPADRQQQIRVMLADALKCVISQSLLKKIGGGRVAALETLFITPAIANLIREGKNFQIPSAMQTGRAYGQRLMNDALVELIQAKQVEPAEGYMKCPDKESYMNALKRAGIEWDLRAHEAQ
jgi:twitching motility protein PilT